MFTEWLEPYQNPETIQNHNSTSLVSISLSSSNDLSFEIRCLTSSKTCTASETSSRSLSLGKADQIGGVGACHGSNTSSSSSLNPKPSVNSGWWMLDVYGCLMDVLGSQLSRRQCDNGSEVSSFKLFRWGFHWAEASSIPGSATALWKALREKTTVLEPAEQVFGPSV